MISGSYYSVPHLCYGAIIVRWFLLLLACTGFLISRADRQAHPLPTLVRVQVEREQSAQRAQQAALEQADALAQERREVEATRGLLLHAHQRIEALEAEVQGLQAEREAARGDRERALEEARWMWQAQAMRPISRTPNP